MNTTACRHQTRMGTALRAQCALVLREMESTFGRSVGGYTWMILEPIGGVALMSVVFTLVLYAPPLGTNFPYFFATGLLPFMLFTSVSTKTAQAIQYSRPLLSYPALTFADALIARFLLNSLTQIFVAVIVLLGIVTVYDLDIHIDWRSVGIGLSMLTAWTAAIGVVNCLVGSIFPVWMPIWSIISRPMFLLSGVLFLPEHVPEAYLSTFMANPLAHVIAQFRKGFFTTYDAVHTDPTYVLLLSGLIGGVSLLLLFRNSHRLLQS